MNSRWQANKIGLVNFWYYDDQEFPFVKGRMLLRGSNGSGKSVTMQSVIPLLLDGNMSPERLDPFGSRDRKMNSYLLEDDDTREERTGYLYLELKRKDTDTYLTIGMGIRARKGKPLDKWYFGLSDGRRVGVDFYLYRELADKVTLSKKELENRIGDGGRVLDRQQDYMDYVNRHVFGFDTLDEYKEMIDLLIQLRTPKLSRDFKPSVINEILSSSLQPLSDEDLRPMSEAIENMDTMNMNLKGRKEAKAAAEKIHRELNKYNSLMLYKKARDYSEAVSAHQKLEAEQRQHQQLLEEKKTETKEAQQQKEELDAKKAALEKEQESLGQSDVLALKRREVDLQELIREENQKIIRKKEQLQSKKDKRIEIEGKLKTEQEQSDGHGEEIHTLLDDLDEAAELFSFEEQQFFKDELEKQLDSSFDYQPHEQYILRTKQDLNSGLAILQEIDLEQRRIDQLLGDRDRKLSEKDGLQRRITELEQLKTQVINEWQEHFFRWCRDNQELILTKEQSRSLAERIQGYEEGFDFGLIRDEAAAVRTEALSSLVQEQRGRETERRSLEEKKEQVQKELSEWEQHKEPVPERSEAVLRNRSRLEAMRIPYIELYKVLEFGTDLDAETCDRLEEALLSMGLLDALVIEECYRDQVLKMDPGCSDHYLFRGNVRAEKSLLDLLDINDSVNNIFFNQQITGILEAIAYGEQETTAIYEDGHYQLGILSGTITGNYEAGFLGTQARERNRQNKIQACLSLLAEINAELEELDKAISILEERQQKVREEYAAFPGDGDLRETQHMLSERLLEAERADREILRLETEIREKKAALEEQQKEALRIAERVYLTCSLEVFREAAEAVEDYLRDFYRLGSTHRLYIQSLQRIRDLEEHLEAIDGDLDQILYDQGIMERNLHRNQEELQSIRKQLELTDYEQIRERLDYCVTWLEDYPVKSETLVRSIAKNEQLMLTLQEELQEDALRLDTCIGRENYLKKCFEEEQKLGYVELPQTAMTAHQIQRTLSSWSQVRETDVLSSLNQAYHENRGALSEYQLMQTELFAEMSQGMEERDYPSAKRYDIAARYQGTAVSFANLLQHLQEDILQLQELIKDGDRELFEDILANTVSRKIRGRINASNHWVEKMNSLMNAMNTSSGLKLNLRWRAKTAEVESQLDTRELVELLKKDYRLMHEEEAARLSEHFRSKVEQARRNAGEGGGTISFYQVMKDTLDYRQWFEFQLFSQKEGERQKELTNSVFGTFSGGEKAMSMYVPLFSAVAAKYDGGRQDAPRLIALDEAFAGVDNRNIRDMFRLMSEFEFDFIINSQVLWGDYETLDALAIYQLIRPANVRFVTVMSYLWNGKVREVLESEAGIEIRAREYN